MPLWPNRNRIPGTHHFEGGSECPLILKRYKFVSGLSPVSPPSVADIKAFLGFAGYYRQFIDGYATLASPLTV
jgi:hypothetical protein